MAHIYANPVGMQKYRAPSLFQPHRAREAIRDAHENKIPPLIGYYAGVSSIAVTRWLAPMGWDMVWIDWEHTSCNTETMTTMVHELAHFSEGKTIPFVRVPGHDHAAIGFALDAGASIIIPQIETVEEAQHVVSAAKYGTHKKGSRSAPPFRLLPRVCDTPMVEGGDLHKLVNEQAAIMLQIESLKGIENLDDILTQVEDIDMVWLGGLDVRVSMGLPGQWGMGSEPEYMAAKQKFMSVMKKHDKPYGGFALIAPPLGSPETATKAAAHQALMVTAVDLNYLTAMGHDLVRARQAVAGVNRQKEL